MLKNYYDSDATDDAIEDAIKKLYEAGASAKEDTGTVGLRIAGLTTDYEALSGTVGGHTEDIEDIGTYTYTPGANNAYATPTTTTGTHFDEVA
jgi:hypothetical protein